MKMSTKKVLLVSAISALMTATTYANENPLTTAPQKSAIKFLEKASSYATKKMEYSSTNPKLTYNVCIDGSLAKKDPAFCPKFYDFMVEYAQKSKKSFKAVTAQDLQDKAFFDSIKEVYVKDAEKNPLILKK